MESIRRMMLWCSFMIAGAVQTSSNQSARFIGIIPLGLGAWMAVREAFYTDNEKSNHG